MVDSPSYAPAVDREFITQWPRALQSPPMPPDGTIREVDGGGRWNEEFSRREVGRVGYLVRATSAGSSRVQDLDGHTGARCYFRAYVDSSLRRVPALDAVDGLAGDEARVLHGWCCDAKPAGLVAPAGLIPGERGEFVPDNTTSVTVRVPPEFVREAARAQLTPKALLESFIGDLAGVQNFIACPRADGYASNGSDERNYAG